MSKSISIRKIGRKAGSGEFTTVKYARSHPRTAIVETIKVPVRRRGKK